MSKKVVITGITSFRNHGVEALVVSTISQLRQRLPAGSTYTVLDRGPEYDASRMRDKDVTFLHDYTIRPLYSGKLRKTITTVMPSLDKGAHAAESRLKAADIVVASGGDVFCSEYGHRSLLSHLQPLKIALKAGKPFVIHAQSIGPFANPKDRQAFIDVAKHAAAVTTREGASYRYITEELKLPPAICHHYADPAFLLPIPAPEVSRAMFAHYRRNADRPTIAISTSQAICHWMKSDADRHVDTLVESIRWMRAELDANVILIPHVQEVSDRNDDRVLATEIQRRLAFDDHVRLAGGDFGASEFKGIISHCDLVVAERMHGAMAGLSSGVPTMVVGYSIKAEGILTDLLGPEATKQSALIAVQAFLEPGAGLARIQAAWHARADLAARLAATLPAARQRAAAAHDRIATICLGG